MNPIDLIALFDLDDDAFRTLFRRTPLWRSKRRGILRNAAIVLGNRPTPRAVDALVKGLRDDEPLIRGACAWALGHYKSRAAQLALGEQSARESDAQVVREITEALAKQNDATFTEKCSPTPN
jgi:epoxyqueuosine reductase